MDVSWLTSVVSLACETSKQWGLGVVLLVAALWFIRVDILLPIVAAHQDFLKHVIDEIDENNAIQRENNELLRDMTTLQYENNALLRRATGDHLAKGE